MKELLRLQGGYPRVIDTVLNLQEEFVTASNGLLSALACDLVLKGCQVTDHGNGTVSIAAGLVYVDGEILRFEGEANIANDSTKAFLKGAYVSNTPAEFFDGSTKNMYREAKAVIGNKSNATQIVVGPTLRTIKTFIEDIVAGAAFKGETRTIVDLDGTFLQNFDGSGLGITPRYYGWALRNGNNGTTNMAGRSIVGQGTYNDPVTGEQVNFDAGATGGERVHKLTIPEMPKHRFQFTTDGDNALDNNLNGFPHGRQNGDNRQSTVYTNYLGNDQPHNNMGPYSVEYMIMKIF